MSALLLDILVVLLFIPIGAIIIPPIFVVINIVSSWSVTDWVWNQYQRYADWWLQFESENGGDSR